MIVIRHDFHSHFWSIFDPTLSLSFTNTFSFLMIIPLFMLILPFMFYHTHDNKTRTQFDWYGIGPPNPNIGCWTATQSAGYRVPETVHLPFNHPVLCWNLLCIPFHFPPPKVQDFLNTDVIVMIFWYVFGTDLTFLNF